MEQAQQLVFHNVGQGTHHHQALGAFRGQSRQHRHHGLQASVLALGEGGFDATARVIEHPHSGVVHPAQTLSGAGQIELDDLGGARAHQKQSADVGAAGQQFVDDFVQLLVGIGQTRQIALVNDGGAKTRLGKNHHARRRLNQVGASARADHQKESVLDFAVQPNDAGQAAKHLALTALGVHRG